MSPAERCRRRAQGLAEKMRVERRYHDADIISSLVKSAAASACANAQLWEDNRQLRERLRQAEREAGG